MRYRIQHIGQCIHLQRECIYSHRQWKHIASHVNYLSQHRNRIQGVAGNITATRPYDFWKFRLDVRYIHFICYSDIESFAIGYEGSLGCTPTRHQV